MNFSIVELFIIWYWIGLVSLYISFKLEKGDYIGTHLDRGEVLLVFAVLPRLGPIIWLFFWKISREAAEDRREEFRLFVKKGKINFEF